MVHSFVIGSTAGFEDGKKLAQDFLPVALVSFLIYGLGKRFGTMPKSGSSLGAVVAFKYLRWVGLAVGLIGIAIMLVNL